MPDFSQNWSAEILHQPPMIAPARQFVYPRFVQGEEDAMNRGALHLLVRSATGGSFLATCALGFTDAAMPTGLFACPDPDFLCAVAGGYAYVIDTTAPEQSTHIPLRPVTEVRLLEQHNLLLFVGFHQLLAWGPGGQLWQSGRLTWEGLRLGGVEGHTLHGFGWNLMTDRDVPFAVDLRTGDHTGGGFTQTPVSPGGSSTPCSSE